MHDLNGTNLDRRCFQQNCLGVIFVQTSKFSERPENLRGTFLENMKNICANIHLRGWASAPQALPPPPPGGGGQACGAHMALRPQSPLFQFTFVPEKSRGEILSRLRYGGAATTCSSSGGQIWSPFWAPEKGNRRHRHHQPSSLSNSMKLFVVHE